MCECIKKLHEALSKDFSDVVMEPVNTINFITGESISYAGKLKYSYRKNKMNGEPRKNRTDGYVLFTFCPFCGEKYHTEKDAQNGI